MRVGLVGCGKVGDKRAAAITGHGDVLKMVADLNTARAQEMGARYGCRHTGKWQLVTAHEEIEAVVVSTFHSALAEVALDALENGKHVLCEKPLGRSAGEAEPVVRMAAARGLILKAGFNHRFHPHIMAAHALVADGGIGRPLFMRAVLGHGGRPGLPREWRGSHAAAGGGALLDQGVHIVDMFRWFLGEIDEVTAWTAGYVWGTGVPPSVEDNVFALMRARSGAITSMHVSWTQWRNTFQAEAYGELGHVRVQGLGGATYGSRLLVTGRRDQDGGPPEERVTEYPPADDSWRDEWSEFRSAISESRRPLGDGLDALATLRVVDAAYASSRRTGVPVESP